MSNSKHTPGPWDRACDSYGKVQHSKKACVFQALYGPDGKERRTVRVASRIDNWDDARLIAAAPDLLAVCEAVVARGHYDTCGYVLVDNNTEGYPCSCPFGPAMDAIAKAVKS